MNLEASEFTAQVTCFRIKAVVGSLLPMLMAALLTACSSSPNMVISNLTERGRLLNKGAAASMNAATVEAYRNDYVPLIYAFALEARQIEAPATAVTDVAAQQAVLSGVRDWRAVTLVGEGYIDAQCSIFLSALDELERQKRATLANINALQSATVGILGLAVAAQKTIGIVGIAFGLAASLFDNTTSSVLYQLPAASVRSVVTAQRDLLRQEEQHSNGPLLGIDNQGLASARLAEYVQYCTPIMIEANIGIVLANTSANASGTITSVPGRPAITSALAPVITALPLGAERVFIQPTNRGGAGILDQTTLQRQLAMINTVRAIPDRATLLRLAQALGLGGVEQSDADDLRRRLRVEIAARVSSQDPTVARREMDTMARLLRPTLGRSF